MAKKISEGRYFGDGSRYSAFNKVDEMLDAQGIKHSKVPMSRTSAKEFKAAITAAKAGNKNGWMVDNHTITEFRGMRCYMADDGKSGFAIKKNGDVVGVFSHSAERGRLSTIIPMAVSVGGRKLDCYGAGLEEMYARFGAKAIGKTPFNKEYAPSDYNGMKVDWVVAMTLPKSLEEVLLNYKSDRKVNLDKVKTFTDDADGYGYDKMIEARDQALVRQSNKGKGTNGG